MRSIGRLSNEKEVVRRLRLHSLHSLRCWLKRSIYVLLIGCGLGTSAVFSQPAAEPLKAASSEEIAGMILNQTVTLLGQEFYRNFVEFWRDKADGENYNIVVSELPSRRFGNQIFVVYNRRRMFTGMLPIRVDKVRAVSEQAVETTYADIVSLGLERPSRDADLDVDEL